MRTEVDHVGTTEGILLDKLFAFYPREVVFSDLSEEFLERVFIREK